MHGNSRKTRARRRRTSCLGDVADLATERIFEARAFPSLSWCVFPLTRCVPPIRFLRSLQVLVFSRGMHMMGRVLLRGVLALLILAFASSLAQAQGSFFSSLSGTVADSSGAVIPGADVKIKNNGTGAEYDTVTASDGGFTIPSLPGGTYTVTVSLMGFKTAVLNSVTLNASLPATVKVTLSVGALEENVTVVGESATVVQTQSPAIATNMTGVQIASLPLTSR